MPVADPDIWLGRATSYGGSRHSVGEDHIIWRIQTFGWGGPHHVANPDIRLGGQFNMLPIISRLFLHWREGAKVYSQTGWGHGRIFPLDPPLTDDAYE